MQQRDVTEWTQVLPSKNVDEGEACAQSETSTSLSMWDRVKSLFKSTQTSHFHSRFKRAPWRNRAASERWMHCIQWWKIQGQQAFRKFDLLFTKEALLKKGSWWHWNDLTELQCIWLLCDKGSVGCCFIVLNDFKPLQNKRRHIYLIFHG